MDRRWLYAGLLVATGIGVARLIRRGPRIDKDTRLLLVGDSLAVGMAPHFRALAKEQRVPFESLAKQGTRIDQWAASRKLAEKLEAFQPTLVLVSLGTNDEYLMGDGGKRQAPHLKALLEKFSRVPHKHDYGLGAEVGWIGPPKLPKKKSNGVIPLLRSTIPETHYFESQKLEIPRGPDKLHPTARGYAGWSGAVWQWIS